MTAKTTTPTTAAEARALADQLAAAEREAESKRLAARKAARLAEARRLLAEDAPKLARSRDEAQAAWDAATIDPAAGIDVLFTAWQNLRTATTTRAIHVAQASSILDQLEPLRHPTSGQPTTHRQDVYDSLVNSSFAAALDVAVSARAAWVRDQTAKDVQAAVERAAEPSA